MNHGPSPFEARPSAEHLRVTDLFLNVRKSESLVQPAAFFFTIARLSSSILGASSPSLALSRKASSPPRWSTVLSALAEIRTRTLRLSESEISVTLRRFCLLYTSDAADEE